MSEALFQVTEPARDYRITFADGDTDLHVAGVTRSQMEGGVLKLFRRSSPEAAEELVVALVLANVRMWSKT